MKGMLVLIICMFLVIAAFCSLSLVLEEKSFDVLAIIVCVGAFVVLGSELGKGSDYFKSWKELQDLKEDYESTLWVLEGTREAYVRFFEGKHISVKNSKISWIKTKYDKPNSGVIVIGFSRSWINNHNTKGIGLCMLDEYGTWASFVPHKKLKDINYYGDNKLSMPEWWRPINTEGLT